MSLKLFIPALLIAAPACAQDGHVERYNVGPVPADLQRGDEPSGKEIKPAQIPAAFRGEWNDPPAACGTANSDMRLRIGARTLNFHESVGEAKRVMRHNANAVTVLATYAGEGQVWDRADRLILSASGDRLTVDTGSTSAVRYRCSGAKK